MPYAICNACGRVYAAVAAVSQALCEQCVARLKGGQRLLRTTFEERSRLKQARFKVAMGARTDWPGEVSLPDRCARGDAWFEMRSILIDGYMELVVSGDPFALDDELGRGAGDGREGEEGRRYE